MRRRRLAQDRAARAGHVTHEPTTDGAGTAVGGFELLPPELRSDDRFDAALDAALAGPAAASARGDHGARDFLRARADLVDVVDHPGDGRDLDTAADLDLLDDPTPR